MLIKHYNIIGKFIEEKKYILLKFFYYSERRNLSNSRGRLLEEQNAAYLDSVRADQEKVCYN
jgi:hypothetical protein